MTSLKNSFESVNDLIKNIKKIEVNENIDSRYNNNYLKFEFEPITNNKQNKIKFINLNQTDKEMFNLSLKKFESNLKDNIYLTYILSLEMLFKLIYKNLISKIKLELQNKIYLNILEKVLFTALKFYVISVLFYKKDYLGLESDKFKIDIPSNFPLPCSKLEQSYCWCDQINKISNSFFSLRLRRSKNIIIFRYKIKF